MSSWVTFSCTLSLATVLICGSYKSASLSAYNSSVAVVVFPFASVKVTVSCQGLPSAAWFGALTVKSTVAGLSIVASVVLEICPTVTKSLPVAVTPCNWPDVSCNLREILVSPPRATFTR